LLSSIKPFFGHANLCVPISYTLTLICYAPISYVSSEQWFSRGTWEILRVTPDMFHLLKCYSIQHLIQYIRYILFKLHFKLKLHLNRAWVMKCKHKKYKIQNTNFYVYGILWLYLKKKLYWLNKFFMLQLMLFWKWP